MSQQGFKPTISRTSSSGLYDENEQYNEHISCVVVVCSGLTSLSTIFQSGCDREFNAHFYCDATLKYHAPDT